MATMEKIDKIYELLDGFNKEECENLMYDYLYKKHNFRGKSLDFYYRNREEIIRKRGGRSEEEKIRLRQLRADWYEKNKERLKIKHKEWRDKKKAEKIAEKAEKMTEKV